MTAEGINSQSTRGFFPLVSGFSCKRIFNNIPDKFNLSYKFFSFLSIGVGIMSGISFNVSDSHQGKATVFL